MTEAEELRGFVVQLLEDLGAGVRDDGGLLWAGIPETVRTRLDLPPQACLTFDAERVGEFDAELVAPGSYLLERLLGLATRRGRWDIARLASAPAGWPEESLRGSVGSQRTPPRLEVLEVTEEPLTLFAFRTALTSDEKRESFQLIAVPRDAKDGWTVPWPLREEGILPANLPGFAPDLSPAYLRARDTLTERIRSEMESFRKASLTSLEEEVRRIFRYFDGTVAEVREAASSGADEVVRVIEAERDRRLAEALERFEPHAVASLCSVRVVFTSVARMAVLPDDGEAFEVRVDALTGHIRGLPPGVTEGGPAPPRDRPPSDIPR